MLQMARKPFMVSPWRHLGLDVKRVFSITKSKSLSPWLIIVNLLGLSNEGGPLIQRCIMRFLAALLACVFLLAASQASAETKVFIIANHADGYGVDQCLAKGDRCGAHAALSYCKSRDFALASAYRRVDPDEITGSVPKADGNCPHGVCDYVAITCQR
jgi:hypothetical protein